MNLSLVYRQPYRYQDSLSAARKADQIAADYAEAYNNIAADYEDIR